MCKFFYKCIEKQEIHISGNANRAREAHVQYNKWSSKYRTCLMHVFIKVIPYKWFSWGNQVLLKKYQNVGNHFYRNLDGYQRSFLWWAISQAAHHIPKTPACERLGGYIFFAIYLLNLGGRYPYSVKLPSYQQNLSTFRIRQNYIWVCFVEVPGYHWDKIWWRIYSVQWQAQLVNNLLEI